MHTARRLYLYLLAGIGLGVLVSGVSLLLTTLFGALGIGGGEVLGGDQALRERLTLATAMTAVSLPVWLIHWFVAERGVRPDRPDADLERSSAVRGLFFALVLGALLIAMFVTATSLLEQAALGLAGEPAEFRDPAGDLGLLVAAAVAWGYHLGIRVRDWRQGPIVAAGAWLPRAYLYVATFAGLFVMLFGLADLLGLLGRIATGESEPVFADGGRWWAHPLASAVARVLVGGATWMGHWWYANRLWADAGKRGELERTARLRYAFFTAVLVVSAAATVGYLGQAAGQLLGAALGRDDLLNGGGADVVSALTAAILFALAWRVHTGWLRRASAEPDGPGAASAERLIAYPAALVGLAFGAVAVAMLIGLLIDTLLGGGRVISGVGAQLDVLAEAVPYAILGLALWLWHWSRTLRAREASPTAEAVSTVRRAALLIALAVAILAGVASLGTILYRLFGVLFGLEATGDVVTGLSTPIGALVVAVAVAAYHGLLLRRDGAAREQLPEVEAPVTAGAVAAAELPIVLVGPPGTDAEELVRVASELERRLPEGFRLRDDRRMS